MISDKLGAILDLLIEEVGADALRERLGVGGQQNGTLPGGGLPPRGKDGGTWVKAKNTHLPDGTLLRPGIQFDESKAYPLVEVQCKFRGSSVTASIPWTVAVDRWGSEAGEVVQEQLQAGRQLMVCVRDALDEIDPYLWRRMTNRLFRTVEGLYPDDGLSLRWRPEDDE